MKSTNTNTVPNKHPAYALAGDRMKEVINNSGYTLTAFFNTFVKGKVHDYPLVRAKDFSFSVFKTALYYERRVTREVAAAVAEGDVTHKYSVNEMDTDFLTTVYDNDDLSFIYSDEGIQAIKFLIGLKKNLGVNDVRQVVNEEALADVIAQHVKKSLLAKSDNFYDTPDNQ